MFPDSIGSNQSDLSSGRERVSVMPGLPAKISRDGFTLVELLIVMGIFITVLIMTSAAFNTVLTNTGKQLKSAETQIEGIVGLELFRSDLQQAGYGLPRGYTDSRWLFPSGTITYDECASWTSMGEINPGSLNDAPTGIPRAVMSINDAGVNGSDYLVIKSMVSGVNDAAKKWTYLSYSSSGGRRKQWGNTNDLVTGDRVVVIKSSFLNKINYKQLVVNGSNYFTTVPASRGLFPAEFSPHSSTDTYLVYGVATNSVSSLRMPFNRTDYFVSRSGTVPASCAPNSGVLYKAMVNHGDGRHSLIPLLDCVVSLQAVYSLDSNGDGVVDSHADASFGTPGAQGALPTDPTLDLLWNQLREIRVYILAQDGKKDSGYADSNNAAYPGQTITVGEFGMGREVNMRTTIGVSWNQYRWKVYNIVVEPKSLTQ